jgi:hypothetical protein
MKFRLDGRNAVVTGAATGIGLAIATALCDAGAKVTILDLNEEAAKSAAAGLRDGEAVACNVADQTEVDRVFATLGRVDILVNNAGIAGIGTVATTTAEDFERVFSVNVKSVYNCRIEWAGGPLQLLDVERRGAGDDIFDRSRLFEAEGALQCDFTGACPYRICGWLPGEELSGARGGDVREAVGVVADGPDGEAGRGGESGAISLLG